MSRLTVIGNTDVSSVRGSAGSPRTDRGDLYWAGFPRHLPWEIQPSWSLLTVRYIGGVRRSRQFFGYKSSV